MRAHKRVSARVSAVLMAAIYGAAINEPASAAVNVEITAYRGPWASDASYGVGVVVTYDGASYICLVANTGHAPNVFTAHWALLDAPGLPGEVGPRGAQGAVGPAGPAGAKGATGATGAPGTQGPAGPAGPAGAAGTQGPAGAQGPIGPVGATGAPGAPGAPGATGSQGPQGIAGATGAAGPQGPAGPAGTNGTGFTYSNTWSGATPYAANDVVTENGTSYVALTINSNIDPANDVATSGGNWAIFAAAGAPGPAGLTGAAGPPGPQGSSGAPGAPGDTGPAGPQGSMGAMGPAGPQGLIGPMGPSGPMGPQGPQGTTGATGAAGPAGPPGATGPMGPAGLNGTNGSNGPAGPQGPPGAMDGSGTANYLPVFTAATTLGTSVIQQVQPDGWSNTAVGINGTPGSGVNTSPVGVDILGTVSEGDPNGYSATQLIVEGTLNSSAYAQAYLRGMMIQPSFNFGAGYGNYAEGAYIQAPNITSGYANAVSTLELEQPTAGASGTSCSAALNIAMPSQSGNCPAHSNLVWSIYNGSPNSSFFAANVGFGVAQPSYPIQTAAGAYVTAGGVWTNASSRELKKDIQPLPADAAMATLAALVPVTFKYKADDEAHVGFIAEDVPELVAATDRKGLSAMDIVAVLAKVVQQQQAQLSDQRVELDALKEKLAVRPSER